MKSVKLRLGGMTCDHCEETVREALLSVPRVTQAFLSQKRSHRAPAGGAETSQLTKAVSQAGYSAAVLEGNPEEGGGKGLMETLDVNKLREEFNRASEFVRSITLLSPT